jgi:DNA polymerase phi
MATLAPSPVMQTFWDLAALDPGTRRKAASSLLGALQASQATWESVEEWEAKVATAYQTTETKLDALAHPDVLYSLKRLFRGISSSREGARLGFSLALTEVRFVGRVCPPRCRNKDNLD